MLIRLKIANILLGLFAIIVFILSRQVPFAFLSPIMNVGSILLVFFYFLQKNLFDLNKSVIVNQITAGILTILLIHFNYSIIISNGDLLTIIRFAIILFLLIIAFRIQHLPHSCIQVFIFLQLLQSILIVLFEAFLIFQPDNQVAIIRNVVIESGWGDVYSNGIFYHIQLRGNALLPFAYMILSLPIVVFKRKKIVRILLLVGNILAGNFAYLLVLIIFTVFSSILKIRNPKLLFRWIVISLISTMIFAFPVFRLIQSKLESKFEGNSVSERIEQVRLLSKSLTQNELTFLFGNGLGYSLNEITQTRDYRGSIYFEIQPLYFLSQMGLIFFVLFLTFNFSVAFLNYRNKQLFLIFCCYWFYGSINPYILDTNNFVVILLLNIINKEEISYFKQVAC